MNLYKTLLNVSIFGCLHISSAYAQVDDKLGALIDIVKELRKQDEVSYNKAFEKLTSLQYWTAMDETGPLRSTECSARIKMRRFKLNGILNRINNSRTGGYTHGDMLNGTHLGFDYSLFERALKANSEVSYQLKGREGRQTFVIVPLESEEAGIKATLKFGNRYAEITNKPDGSIVLEYNGTDLNRDSTIVLTVFNKDNTPQAFVILNHNSRKQ